MVVSASSLTQFVLYLMSMNIEMFLMFCPPKKLSKNSVKRTPDT